jgi:hypothetical protein
MPQGKRTLWINIPRRGAGPKPKGKLKLDATVSDIYIKYPTDLGLLNTSRAWSEKIIDALYEKLGGGKKPRTYRKVARQEYLNVAKKKKKGKKEIRRGIKIRLNCLKRNFGYIKPCWMKQEAPAFLYLLNINVIIGWFRRYIANSGKCSKRTRTLVRTGLSVSINPMCGPLCGEKARHQ